MLLHAEFGIFWLVVYLPLWKIWVRQLGLLFPTEWKHKIHVPNHQPALDIFATYVYLSEMTQKGWYLYNFMCHFRSNRCYSVNHYSTPPSEPSKKIMGSFQVKELQKPLLCHYVSYICLKTMPCWDKAIDTCSVCEALDRHRCPVVRAQRALLFKGLPLAVQWLRALKGRIAWIVHCFLKADLDHHRSKRSLHEKSRDLKLR